MAETPLVLGFYGSRGAAQQVLSQLRRRRIFRVALIHKSLEGRVVVDDSGVSTRHGALIGGLAGVVGATLLPRVRASNVMAGLAGAAGGYLVAHALDTGIEPATLERYRRWVVRGETLLLIEARAEQVSALIDILRGGQGGQPTVYVVRPAPHLTRAKTESPMRGEPYTLEQLQAHAAQLAKRHQAETGMAPRLSLLARLDENARIINTINRALREAVRLEQPVSIAAEWMLDNAYIIESQIADVRRNLTQRFYSELPLLARGPCAGVPRVYAIACELIAHCDGRLDLANIEAFLTAYQQVTPLKMGELWAVPLVLRLGLIENLRRLGIHVERRQRERERADFWANRLLNAARHDADHLVALLADLAAEQPQLQPHFADRLVSHLYDDEASMLPVQTWMEHKLDLPLREIMQQEQRRQATDQLAVANIVTSLRFLMQIDWREIFEEQSLVHQTLREDPAAIYDHVDFTTRDQYRHQVERIARRGDASELEVARLAVLHAGAEIAGAAENDVARHVGYHLQDGGLPALEAAASYQCPFALRAQRWALDNATSLYLGATLGFTLLGGGGVWLVARRVGGRHAVRLAMAALLPASELAVQSVNYLTTRLLSPRPLAKMDYEGGVPDEYRTIVVVPMMLSSDDAISEEVERLEVHFLANRDSNLRFALLADYRDAADARVDEDDALLEAARSGIRALNARHAAEAGLEPFLLFHRERGWSESEQRFMGWERKRGKLEQLNQVLTGAATVGDEVLHVVEGDAALLEGVRFVITLDADTQLPHDAARRMIETLAHPLNRPVVAPGPNGRECVKRGYTVIQPRVSSSLPSATATRFARLFTDPSGADPYTHVVSDVYQDLFAAGSYHGKGIYDLQVFHRILTECFPPATLLSHDLIEGAHVRVGLASDIELFDQFPPNYHVYSKRQHRWIRGDWQIAGWLRGMVPGASGGRVAGTLGAIDRWKIADNLRRSLVTPGVMVLLGAGWAGSPLTAAVASGLATLFYLYPTLTTFSIWVTSRPGSVQPNWREMGAGVVRAAIEAALLPHQATVALDAIGRVAWRRLVSKQLLLEWETAQSTYRAGHSKEGAFLWRLGLVGGLAAGAGALVLLANPGGAMAAAPYLAAWLLAPAIVRWLRQERQAEMVAALPEADRRLLRRIARQTWRYFDDFVGPQTNWLPPDNYQETLRVEIAQRTSPTNIGLWLLAVQAANDFGYITVDEVIGRTLPTLQTLGDLEQYNGHILNWYDVQTLEPLKPRYVSTVDSGNLLVSLWTWLQGCDEMLEKPLLNGVALSGLQDTLDLLREVLGEETSDTSLLSPIDAVERLLTAPAEAPHELVARLRAAAAASSKLAEALSVHAVRFKLTPREYTNLQEATADPRIVISPPSYWAAHLDQQLDLWLHCINRYLLWMEKLAQPTDEWLVALGEAAVSERQEALAIAPSLNTLAQGTVPALAALLARKDAPGAPPEVVAWLGEVEDAFARACWLAGEMRAVAEEVRDRVRRLADEMDMRFLYNPARKLFSIGLNVEDMRLDSSYYDLLASECRLASLAAIARGQVPVEHWVTLGRRFSHMNGRSLLLSWSGTMFEYLMPLIFTRSYENSLLDLACRNAVKRQQDYGRQLGIPWGVSEAAFSALDVYRIYQYKAFGVPGLGLKRGLETEFVVAPYASALALMVDAPAAVENLRRLAALGARGDYGFYDSVDYGRQRLAEDGEPAEPVVERGAIVRTYMVHHQAMSLLALDNVLNDNVLQTRFHDDPYIRAVTPLLYERIPAAPPTIDEALPEAAQRPLKVDAASAGSSLQKLQTPDTPYPRVHLLSNGNYALMLTNAGGGYSRWRDIDITRWRADTTRDNWGTWIYVRDVESSSVWSVTHQPLRRAARRSNITFKAERAEFQRRDAEVETITEITVSPEDDAEIRRVTLVNRSGRPRRLEVTSYAEIALAPHNADRAHPAFVKLFVQTEALPERHALIAWRRLRSASDPVAVAAHLVTGAATEGDVFECETDRARFTGRGRTAENPVALEGPLSNTTGAVLDPIFSVRRRVTIAPGERVTLVFATVAAESREKLLPLIEKYADLAAARRAFDLAWNHAQLEMHHLRVQAEDVARFQHLASHLVYPTNALRAPARRLRQNRLGQSRLWAYGISGDLPIMVVTLDNERDIGVVRQALLAHTFWRVHGLKSDLVILNEQAEGYEQALSDQLKALINAHSHYTGVDVPGGIFLRAAGGMPLEDRVLLLAVARVVLVAARGSLAQQLSQGDDVTVHTAPRLVLGQRHAEEPSSPLPFMELPYFNGFGGFTPDGREYAIYLGPNQRTPAPWINVMANPQFGAMVSEAGSGYAWYGNSQANRLMPWSNDAVADPPGDAVYIRDEESGAFWSPTPLPVRELDAYRARHGQGYTVFEHNSHAIEQRLEVFVPHDDAGGVPLRIQRLKLRNHSSRTRRLRVTAYTDWTLGTTREETQAHLVTSWDAAERILLARNAYHPDYGERYAFLSAGPRPRSFSGDRSEFIGRNGSLSNPAAMRRSHLAERCGTGLDACGAVQVLLEIEAGGEAEVSFFLGEAASVDEVRALVHRFRDPRAVESALETTRAWWDGFLGTLQVELPDQGATFLINRWLLYQTLSCRIWARSALYQSGGAYGFRDQLQDVMAVVYAAPQVAREQILRAAAHQFVEGDVQHWWHPPSDAGVRTRFADDLLWLPYVTAHYVRVTGDRSVLDEVVPFIEVRLLEPDEHEVYLAPHPSPESATVFEHCRRAIEKGTTAGAHGLPLIGTGDWNDGMNRVGAGGKGESVWMAWFLVDVLHNFAELCELPGADPQSGALAATYRERAAHLAATVEKVAWDGQWYLRAFYDDGAPLGSHTSDEAQIDSLPQSWGIISGAADPERVATAMSAVENRLVRDDDEMILLFTPPFDKSERDPGYIKGYLPGVRENGGQYTHAAIWVAIATARQGDGDRAVELLRMLNPIEHARTTQDVQRYKVEPYVVAADVYALPGRVGQGGWTWYTGSCSWMYRAWVEEVLGFRLRGDKLVIDPVLPRAWDNCKIRYRYNSAHYEITIANPEGVNRGVAWVEVDGKRVSQLALQDDGKTHIVTVRLGSGATPAEVSLAIEPALQTV